VRKIIAHIVYYKLIIYHHIRMGIKKSLNYQLTISTIIGLVFFLMSANFAFGQAFSLDPNQLNDQALALMDSGNLQQALDYLNRALAIDPDNVNVLNNKGQVLIGLGNLEEAIVSLDKALEVEPLYVHALNNKGNALLGLDKTEEAIVWFDKALEVDPNYLYALNNKGFALNTLEQYDKAIVWLDKALDVDPNYVIAQQNKVLVQQNLGLPQQSTELVQQNNELAENTPTDFVFEWYQLLILIPIVFGIYLVQHFRKKSRNKENLKTLKK